MKVGILKKVAIGVICALSITSAHAAVTVIKEHDPVDESRLAKFSQVGLSGEKAKIISGYGEDMPFLISLDIIVPEGWKTNYNKGAEKYTVNWQGNVSWPYVLKDMSDKNNISISINWNKKIVDFFSHEANNEVIEKEKETTELVNLVESEQENIKKQYLLEKEKELRTKYELANKIAEEKLKSQEDAENAAAEHIKKLEEHNLSLQKEKEEIEKNLTNLKETQVKANESDKPLDEVTIQDLTKNPVETSIESKFANLDIKALKKEYDEKSVLPLDSSFKFYIEGGYEQEFDYYTPATFIAKRGLTLFQVINGWAESMGSNDSTKWEVMWDTNTHYTVDYDMRFEGIVKEASTSLILLYKDAKRPLDIEYYPDQRLIVVSDLEFK